MTRAIIICLAVLFACVCNAQGQERTAKIVEVLPDDQFIVEIAGKEYRALNPDKVVELAKQKVDLKECRDNEGNYKQIILLAAKDIKIAEQQRDIEHSNFIHAMSLYEKERELRTEAMQFIPHGKVGGFGGKFLSFLDSAAGQSLFKLVIPTATFIKTIRQ